MYRATFTPEEGWRGGLEPYGPMQMQPSAQVRQSGMHACLLPFSTHMSANTGLAESTMMHDIVVHHLSMTLQMATTQQRLQMHAGAELWTVGV